MSEYPHFCRRLRASNTCARRRRSTHSTRAAVWGHAGQDVTHLTHRLRPSIPCINRRCNPGDAVHDGCAPVISPVQGRAHACTGAAMGRPALPQPLSGSGSSSSGVSKHGFRRSTQLSRTKLSTPRCRSNGLRRRAGCPNGGAGLLSICVSRAPRDLVHTTDRHDSAGTHSYVPLRARGGARSRYGVGGAAHTRECHPASF